MCDRATTCPQVVRFIGHDLRTSRGTKAFVGFAECFDEANHFRVSRYCLIMSSTCSASAKKALAEQVLDILQLDPDAANPAASLPVTNEYR